MAEHCEQEQSTQLQILINRKGGDFSKFCKYIFGTQIARRASFRVNMGVIGTEKKTRYPKLGLQITCAKGKIIPTLEIQIKNDQFKSRRQGVFWGESGWDRRRKPRGIRYCPQKPKIFKTNKTNNLSKLPNLDLLPPSRETPVDSSPSSEEFFWT